MSAAFNSVGRKCPACLGTAFTRIADPPTAVGAVGTESSKSLGEALAPIPAVLSPLYEVEDWILAFAETEELVSEDQRLAFLAELSEAMQTGKAKRDQVGGFIKHLELLAESVLASEIKRLQTRKRIAENTAERLRQYVLWIIEGLGTGPDGKLRKLEGEKFTFATRKAKPKLEITDEAAIPFGFKTASVTMSAVMFFQYKNVLEALLGSKMLCTSLELNEDALREYLEGAPAECEGCSGTGRVLDAGRAESTARDEAKDWDCRACGGSGVIPPSVSGARLLTDRNSLILR